MPNDWAGRIAFILALAVAITLVAGVIIAEVAPGAVTDAEISFFSVLGGGAIAEVATYIALKTRRTSDKKEEQEEEDARK